MRKILYGAAAMIVVAGVGYYASADYRAQRSVAAACEEKIRERLITAGSYRREAAPEVYRRVATLEDHMGWTVPGKRDWDARMAQRLESARRLEDLKRDGFNATDSPELVAVFIEYTGQRRDLGLITGPSQCTIVVEVGRWPTPGELDRDLRVDGFTSTEYSMYRLDQIGR